MGPVFTPKIRWCYTQEMVCPHLCLKIQRIDPPLTFLLLPPPPTPPPGHQPFFHLGQKNKWRSSAVMGCSVILILESHMWWAVYRTAIFWHGASVWGGRGGGSNDIFWPDLRYQVVLCDLQWDIRLYFVTWNEILGCTLWPAMRY